MSQNSLSAASLSGNFTAFVKDHNCDWQMLRQKGPHFEIFREYPGLKFDFEECYYMLLGGVSDTTAFHEAKHLMLALEDSLHLGLDAIEMFSDARFSFGDGVHYVNVPATDPKVINSSQLFQYIFRPYTGPVPIRHPNELEIWKAVVSPEWHRGIVFPCAID